MTDPSERLRAPDLRNLGDVVTAGQAAPDQVAVIDLSRPAGQPVSYRDLARMARRIGGHVQSRGLARGSRVGILSLNRVEYIAAYFGAMQAGYTVVPLNAKLPDDTLDFIIRDGSVELIFVDRVHRERPAGTVPFVDFDDPAFLQSGPTGPASSWPSVRPDPGDIAEILYTSGSSGVPKGVALSHAGQIWALAVLCESAPHGPHRHIVAQPLYHMNGIVVTSMALLTGGTIVLQPRFDAAAYVRAIGEYRVDSVSAVPTMWARAVKEVEAGTGDISSVTSLSLGSAPVTAELLRRTRSLQPRIRISLSYGTTEAGPAVFGPHPQALPAPDLALGYPVPGIEVRLVDGSGPDDGVLTMRTPAVMHGYHGLPERTDRVLSDGWYYSGDVMRRDSSGFYYFVGRADDMFVCSGENIYPGEVEKVLERHPAVHQASVVPLADEERGHMPVAFVVLTPGMTATAAEIQRFSLDHAAPYLHPRRVAIRPELPWAATNKIDRAALIEEAERLEATGGWTQP